MERNREFKQTVSMVREDTAPEKRVELSCHTKMSNMDGAVDVWDLLARARDWGHQAVAITDSRGVYAFPEADRFIRSLGEENSFKAIYGMEGFLTYDVQGESFFHVSILAKDEIGKVNLYELVSLSHLEYFKEIPLIPRDVLIKHREGLLFGSGCGKGELFQAVLNDEPEERLAEIVSFYDYLEVQPAENNRFLIAKEEFPEIREKEDIRNINRKIVELGERFHKPVVATGNVHYLDPEEDIILRAAKFINEISYANEMPLLFLRTTEEMTDEFAYLGKEKAKEIVIVNTNRIADEIEKISPLNTQRCWYKFKGDGDFVGLNCQNEVHALYGEVLPDIVEERMKSELRLIKSREWSDLFILYSFLLGAVHRETKGVVGYRGTLGASFVAFLLGLTEINPLAPHYVCPWCHYTDFEPETGERFVRMTGFDLPDKSCPRCGKPLRKAGFALPQETFFGINGEKEPDIVLNVPRDLKDDIEKFAKLIFDGEIYCAGTIATMGEISAVDFINRYNLKHGMQIKEREVEYIARGCSGMRYGTGKHPGRFLLLPREKNDGSYTPKQHPGDDMDTRDISTHFDYHELEPALTWFEVLKNEGLGMMERLLKYINSPNMGYGFDEAHPFFATDIPLDDPEVISLFRDASALGISPEDIDGVLVGTSGVPEFDSDHAISILLAANPKTFSDLIQIVALSRGVDVWQQNAECLIREGKASISEVIATRDDILNDLVRAGMKTEDAYAIMEAVRKGTVATGRCLEWPEYKERMRKVGMPDWYIASCEKIRYMFPRAHAAVYTVMAYRIAYCKIHYPLAFYATYFETYSYAFPREKLSWGTKQLQMNIRDYRSNYDALDEYERDQLKVLKVLLEMKARGFESLPDPEQIFVKGEDNE